MPPRADNPSERSSEIRLLPIVMPSGRREYMVFTQTVTSPVLQIDYGLVPADPNRRPPMVHESFNEQLECLSPEVLEDVPPDHFFFYFEHSEGDVGPPVLNQLIQLRVLAPTGRYATRGRLAGIALLVKVLLAPQEIAHACLSGTPRPVRHWESPNRPFVACASCARVRGRHLVYFCSPECQQGWYHVHNRDCGKTRKELGKYLESVARVTDPTAARFAFDMESKQIGADLTHFIRWPMERRENGCQDLLPGF